MQVPDGSIAHRLEGSRLLLRNRIRGRAGVEGQRVAVAVENAAEGLVVGSDRDAKGINIIRQTEHHAGVAIAAGHIG